jgi:hypothetical protein
LPLPNSDRTLYLLYLRVVIFYFNHCQIIKDPEEKARVEEEYRKLYNIYRPQMSMARNDHISIQESSKHCRTAEVANSIVHVAQVVPRLVQTSDNLPEFALFLIYGQVTNST